MDYAEANGLLTGRNKDRRKLANNTYLERRPNDEIAVKLHSTDILTFRPNGDTVYESGGWRTVTTKERMNRFGPAGRVSSDRGAWTVSVNGKDFPYADGLIIHKDETVNGQGAEPDFKMKRKIRNYSAAYMRMLFDGQVSAPNGGDCWYCYFQTEDGSSLGDATKHADHLRDHIQENYFVPSLLVRAVKRFRVSQVANAVLGSIWYGGDRETKKSEWFGGIAKEQLQKSLRRYLNERLGFSA